MKNPHSFFKLLPLVCLLIVSCNNIGEITDIHDQEHGKDIVDNLKGEAGVVRAIEDFIFSIKNDPSTRSGVNTSIGRVVKKSVFDYSPDNAATRSTTDDIAVYEVTLENSDNTQGFAIVADENSPTLIAFSEVGSVADTTYNKGLAFWFREMANTLAAEASATRAYDHDLYEDTREGGTYYTDIRSTEELYMNRALVSKPDDARYLGEDWYATPFLAREYSTAYIPISWSQDDPYNMMITARGPSGGAAKVGCFGIAAAGIICYYSYLPDYDWIDFPTLNRMEYLTSGSDMILKMHAASLCKAIAEDSKATQWFPGEAAGNTSQMSVEPVFRNKFNYHIRETNGFNPTLVKREMGLGRPMMMGATAYLINGDRAGHIWVIDGYHMAAKYHYYYRRTTKVVNKKTMYSYDVYRCRAEIDMYHMKWGWGLNGNGWYATFEPWNMTGHNYERQIYLFSEIYPNR